MPTYTFAAELARFRDKTGRLAREVFVGGVADVQSSVVFGSTLTGAPGQPVATGELRGSWATVFESPDVAVVGTKVAWAPQNENGIARPGGGPYIQRSAIGGRWSVALTVAGWPRIVEAVAKRFNP